jgi:hypothetical protein
MFVTLLLTIKLKNIINKRLKNDFIKLGYVPSEFSRFLLDLIYHNCINKFDQLLLYLLYQ